MPVHGPAICSNSGIIKKGFIGGISQSPNFLDQLHGGGQLVQCLAQL